MPIITNKINLVVGLGRSGYWAAKFLNSRGKKVIVLEEKINDQLAIYKKDLENFGIEIYLEFPFKFEKISQWIKNLNYLSNARFFQIQMGNLKKLLCQYFPNLFYKLLVDHLFFLLILQL